jgi:hypothetical protein
MAADHRLDPTNSADAPATSASTASDRLSEAFWRRVHDYEATATTANGAMAFLTLAQADLFRELVPLQRAAAEELRRGVGACRPIPGSEIPRYLSTLSRVVRCARLELENERVQLSAKRAISPPDATYNEPKTRR